MITTTRDGYDAMKDNDNDDYESYRHRQQDPATTTTTSTPTHLTANYIDDHVPANGGHMDDISLNHRSGHNVAATESCGPGLQGVCCRPELRR